MQKRRYIIQNERYYKSGNNNTYCRKDEYGQALFLEVGKIYVYCAGEKKKVKHGAH